MKLAFVHLMRTGGTWVNSLFSSRFHRDHFHNSWAQQLERDWTLGELTALSKAPGPCYVHNHSRNWTPELVRIYRDAGFTLFSFLRHPGEQLCSLYYWLLHVCPQTDISLDEFLRIQLSGESWQDVSHGDWAIPGYLGDLDLVAEFSIKNVVAFVEYSTNVAVSPDECAIVNGSRNPGLQSCVENGLVSGEVCRLLEHHASLREYEELTQGIATALRSLGVD